MKDDKEFIIVLEEVKQKFDSVVKMISQKLLLIDIVQEEFCIIVSFLYVEFEKKIKSMEELYLYVILKVDVYV